MPGQQTPEGMPSFKMVLVGDGGTGNRAARCLQIGFDPISWQARDGHRSHSLLAESQALYHQLWVGCWGKSLAQTRAQLSARVRVGSAGRVPLPRILGICVVVVRAPWNWRVSCCFSHSCALECHDCCWRVARLARWRADGTCAWGCGRLGAAGTQKLGCSSSELTSCCIGVKLA